MNTTYPTAGERLRSVLAPQTRAEHETVDWLAGTLPSPGSLDVLAGLVERRMRTVRRAAEMRVAQLTLAYWHPNVSAPRDIVAQFEHLSSGGDVDQLTRDQQVGDERRGGEQ